MGLWYDEQVLKCKGKVGMSKNLLKKYKEEPAKLTVQQKDKLIMEYAPLIKFIVSISQFPAL